MSKSSWWMLHPKNDLAGSLHQSNIIICLDIVESLAVVQNICCYIDYGSCLEVMRSRPSLWSIATTPLSQHVMSAVPCLVQWESLFYLCWCLNTPAGYLNHIMSTVGIFLVVFVFPWSAVADSWLTVRHTMCNPSLQANRHTFQIRPC